MKISGMEVRNEWKRSIGEHPRQEPCHPEAKSIADVRIHWHESGFQIWVFRSIAGTVPRLGWVPSQYGDEHPELADYVLSMRQDCTPSWVKRASREKALRGTDK